MGSADLGSQYLPEQFLWHIFKGLMEAAKTLEAGPFEKMAGFGQPFPNSYMVHCDIKPENSECALVLGDMFANSGSFSWHREAEERSCL